MAALSIASMTSCLAASTSTHWPMRVHLVLFQVLIVIEKVGNLVAHNLRQVTVGADIRIKRMEIVHGNGN